MDLSTEYLGLKLKNPLVPSASPLSRSLDTAKRLEDAGASALIMYSLFEEEIYHEQLTLGGYLYQQGLGHPEATSFLPFPIGLSSELDLYLEQLQKLKASLDIPVIASLNGVDVETWVDFGKELQEAGADALELNVYHIPADIDEPGAAVEQRYIALLKELKAHVTLPIAMKLSSQFSAPGNMVKRLAQAGAQGVALFNRFYQPDIELDNLRVAPRLHLSSSAENLMVMRWIAILHGRVDLTLAATTGIHTAEDVLKMVLAGADITHMASALIKHGPRHLERVLADLERWLQQHEYHSLNEIRGILSQAHTADPTAYDRVNYVRMLESYHLSAGVWR